MQSSYQSHASRRLIQCFCSALLATTSVALPTQSVQADWPQFRGANANPVLTGVNLPIEFAGESKKNVAWKTSIPGRSVGGVIVVGNQVITTSSDGMDQRRLYILSYDAKDGKQLWKQELIARGRPYAHPTSANAAPTPASDGENVYAFFSSNDLACVSLEGDLVWYRSLTSEFPKAANDTGMSSSPLLIEGVCVVQVECQGDSFAAGLDASTGAMLWKIDRPTKANWSSPTSMTDSEGRKLVLMHSGEDVLAVRPKDGSIVWRLETGCSTVPSSLAFENKLYVPAGGITAFDLSSTGTPSKLWTSNKANSNACSPLVKDGRIYTVNRTVLVCSDIYTGKVLWQLRIAEGSIWSSPVIVGDRLYLFSQDGVCSVVKLGDEQGEKLASNPLGEEVLGSPAISGDAMYVRSVSSLWKIAE
ncbi:PQQ-binding-like beta-propeller repeat protein [Pirellulaceae bacterium SH501]